MKSERRKDTIKSYQNTFPMWSAQVGTPLSSGRSFNLNNTSYVNFSSLLTTSKIVQIFVMSFYFMGGLVSEVASKFFTTTLKKANLNCKSLNLVQFLPWLIISLHWVGFSTFNRRSNETLQNTSICQNLVWSYYWS